MAEYAFACPSCRLVTVKEQRMNDDHTPPACECGQATRRLYDHNSICDEIRGRTYFDPIKKVEVRDHGKYFDIGMGQWIFSKSDRRNKAARLGLVEHGPRMV